jgi:ParB family chromosome partitioning protein
MWWSVPEADPQRPDTKVRSLALAGSLQKRQRTVLTTVSLSMVTPNPDQPRKHFAEDALAELAASIKTRGLLQPIVVSRIADGYQLLAGERRFRAAQLAGLDRVPALIREGDDTLEIALIENLQREDLSPLEEAEALSLLIERHGYNHREVADLLGKSRPYVSNTLALVKLPESVKTELHREGRAVSRELLMGIARQETPEAAEALWKRSSGPSASGRRPSAPPSATSSSRPGVSIGRCGGSPRAEWTRRCRRR